VAKQIPIGSIVEEFPGGTFNELVRDLLNRRGERLPPPNTQTGTGPSLIVSVKNSSGGDLGPGAVLGIDGPLFPYGDDNGQVYRRPVVDGVTPALPEHANAFVVLTNHIVNGKRGAGVLMGLTWVRVDVTNTGHTHAKVKDAETDYLESGSSGFPLIYKQTASTGQQWGLVSIGGGGGSTLNVALATADSTISGRSGGTPGTGDVTIVKGTGSDEDWENWSVVDITSGSYVVAIEIDGDMVIVAAFCEEE
jgi:hypothetical protein